MVVFVNAVADVSAEDRAATALRALLQAGDSYRLKVAAQFGLGWTDIQAVGHLMVGELGQTELAHRIGISTAAATALVDRLERSGIAARHAHPDDRRRSLIRLTEKGHAVIARSREWTRYAFANLPQERLDAFAGELHDVAMNLNARADQL